MDASVIWDRHPYLFHMATGGSWESISRKGLLSTTALLDLFEYTGQQRHEIECCHRPESVPITHPVYGTAVIRDQKPMSDRSLKKCLKTVTPKAWYKTLNRMVFFWLTEERLKTMLNARAYWNKKQDVLVVDTRSLVTAYEASIHLSPMNSGCTVPFAHPRGPKTFQEIKDYPYEEWKKKRGKNGDLIVELAVFHSVPDICKHVLRVESRRGNKKLDVLWEKPINVM